MRVMESKIIQIGACEQNGVHVITALCEDGSVYNSYDCNEWKLFEVPFKAAQQDTKEKNLNDHQHTQLKMFQTLSEELDLIETNGIASSASLGRAKGLLEKLRANA